MADHEPPLCRTCGRRVRRWQRHDGVGPLGFNRRNAAILWHSKCGIEGATATETENTS